MRVDELRGRRVAIWGFAREGQAALRFLRERDPGLAITVLDDADSTRDVDVPLISGRAAIAAAIGGFDVVVKSPGISLYDPLVVQAQADGVRFTSLLNLWFADAPTCRTICVTGTKGKSTTTALIAHILRGVGWNAMAAGNIGVPVTELPRDGLDAAVIEVSSYQAADFSGLVRHCRADLAAPGASRLAWQRGGVSARQAEPAASCAASLISRDAVAAAGERARPRPAESCDVRPVFGAARGQPLSRAPAQPVQPGRALAVARSLGVDPAAALRAAEDFPPLPHRQQEIGEVDGVLYVDDSISTTPEATIAALDVYRDRAVTVIIGGHDRGIDYAALVARLQSGTAARRRSPRCQRQADP